MSRYEVLAKLRHHAPVLQAEYPVPQRLKPVFQRAADVTTEAVAYRLCRVTQGASSG